MNCIKTQSQKSIRNWRLSATALLVLFIGQIGALGANINLVVKDRFGVAIAPPYKWLLEEDNTALTVPGTPVNNSVSLVIHKSHAPVSAAGQGTTSPTAIVNPDPAKRYLISVMKDGYAVGGAMVDPTKAPPGSDIPVTVILNKHPLPTAQISVLVHEDHYPINNVWDPTEAGLPSFKVEIFDYAGGPMMQDAFGNPLGTTYQFDKATGEPLMVDGAPVINKPGDGVIYTDANGKAVIKYLAMGKYGVVVIPPEGTDWRAGGATKNVRTSWNQTSTIEGTLTIDAWVKANEPVVFIEGFGAGSFHAMFGFVKPDALPWGAAGGTGGLTLRGTNVFNHFGKPPQNQMFARGPVVDSAWVGLNEMIGGLPGRGLYAAPCNADGTFEIPNVPPGTYQLVSWDTPLDALFGFNTVTVADGAGSDTGLGNDGVCELGDVLSYRWFGTLEGSVFYDEDADGFRDPAEEGIHSQAVNIRWRNGALYQATQSQPGGDYSFSEVFPFFKWLVAEVDFARFKATGLTTVVDDGGIIPTDNGWTMPSEGVRNPQPQYEIDPATGYVLTNNGAPVVLNNINTGNNLSRTEAGPTLTAAMHLFLNQNNRIDWGKKAYAPGENGGISGIVYYSVTRAEDDPRQAVGDPWEPGIPRVQVALYEHNGLKTPDQPNLYYIKDQADQGTDPTLADVDNYPFGWLEGTAPKGPEDFDQDPTDGPAFNPGDAIQIVRTDSWDDNAPGAVQLNPPMVLGKPIVGSDNYSTWNQVQPGVFDGGYAFTSYVPGGMASGNPEVEGLPLGFYVVQASTPPGYLLQTEEAKNVDFGDAYKPSKLALFPELVGDLHTVPPYLTLFPDQMVEAPFAGTDRPLPDRKLVRVNDGRNAAADFHMYTEVPKATRIVGFVLNDFTAEFNAFSPIFGEKGSPGWLPISIRDWADNEVVRVYSDEYGGYEALVPSTYTVNVPSPSGVAPNMLTLVLNHPTRPDGTPDPFYNPNFATTPWTLMFYPGCLSYLDTPIVPIAALVGFPNTQLDVEPPSGTPVIHSVTNLTTSVPGPYLANTNQTLVITSLGNAVEVQDPTSIGYQANATITRDYGFGNPGTPNSSVTIVNVTNPAVFRTLTTTLWSPSTIRATVPPGTPNGEYQLLVTRLGVTSPIGVTLTLGGPAPLVVSGPGTPSELDPLPNPIQDAIDAATAGRLIIVAPGEYKENPIFYKPLRLQGAGAGTIINANPTPTERLTAWGTKMTTVLGGNPFTANAAPGIMALGLNPNAFRNRASRIDGFQINGAIAGGGISLFNNAHNLRISNNRIVGNQGTYGGGISIGMQGNAGTLYNNTGVTIERNQILKNGGVSGAGGIAVFNGAANYKILNNDIAGNFCRGNGGGISHEGRSPGGLIAGNRIAFNEVFFGVLVGGDGAGIFITGEQAIPGALGSGSGSVTIRDNLIQGNLAGSGNGGGIRAAAVNGQEVDPAAGGSANQSDWYALDIINNIIVNNVAGWAGGGISLQDAVRARVIHNTIANNASTATSRSAFPPGVIAGTVDSEPGVAGITAHQHSVLLAAFVPGLYSAPVMENNIIYQNQSFYFRSSDQSLQPRTGGGYWDLGVPEDASVTLNSASSVMTGTDPLFVASYVNTLHTAVVIDEAGNNISVRLEQLLTGAGNDARVNYGDYHIKTGSPALDTATGSSLAIAYDIDRQTRPAASVADAGADEYYGGSVATTTVAYATTAPLAGPAADGLAPTVTPPLIGPGVPPTTEVQPQFAFEPVPKDQDGVDTDGDGNRNNDYKYYRLGAGDGFSRMADGNELYTFGFQDLTGKLPSEIVSKGTLRAEIVAPTIELKEGQQTFLDLSNVGMLMRPDLFDPHTIHFHGFPQAVSIFDGEPFASVAVNMGFTFRYFYNIVEPGTYLYHCHAEATEHMEMGMIGNLFVLPKQNNLPNQTFPNGYRHNRGSKYVYNDGDGSTRYNVEYPIQLTAFDRAFHEEHIKVQPLPFWSLDENYPMLNGRGYPDTVSMQAVVNTNVQEVLGLNQPYPSQPMNALVKATVGQKILLRLSNVSLSDFHTFTVLGLPMRVVGKDARLLRGPTGVDLSYETASVTLGGGETADVIVDTTGVTPGTYFLYDARLNHLSNDQEDFGGAMTEIRITAPAP